MGDDWRQYATRRAKVALINTTTPNAARVGDYLYGGPNNFEAGLVAGLDLVPPGLVPISEWRPAATDPRFEDLVPVHGAVGRKP